MTAPQCAGVIHTDFEKSFIKAEVVSYDELISAGSLQSAREAGKVRLEGKIIFLKMVMLPCLNVTLNFDHFACFKVYYIGYVE